MSEAKKDTKKGTFFRGALFDIVTMRWNELNPIAAAAAFPNCSCRG
jgi:hypothetical protein